MWKIIGEILEQTYVSTFDCEDTYGSLVPDRREVVHEKRPGCF